MIIGDGKTVELKEASAGCSSTCCSPWEIVEVYGYRTSRKAHRLLTGTKLYCVVMGERMYQQLDQSLRIPFSHNPLHHHAIEKGRIIFRWVNRWRRMKVSGWIYLRHNSQLHRLLRWAFPVASARIQRSSGLPQHVDHLGTLSSLYQFSEHASRPISSLSFPFHDCKVPVLWHI